MSLGIQIADIVPLTIAAVSIAGVAGVGIKALGVWTHSKRLEIIGAGVQSAALQIHQDMALLPIGVDVNAWKDAKVAQWVGTLTARNAGLIKKTGMPADLLNEKIDSAVHALDLSSSTALLTSGASESVQIENRAATALDAIQSLRSATTVATPAAPPSVPVAAVVAPAAQATSPITLAPGQVGSPALGS